MFSKIKIFEKEQSTSPLSFSLNIPFDFSKVEELQIGKEDLKLLWPSATFPLEKDEWRDWMHEDDKSISYSYIINYKNKPSGHIAFKKYKNDPGLIYLCLVFLEPSLRGKGVSYNMFDMVISDMAHKLNLSEIYLLVEKENPRALGFYRRYGFEITDYPNGKIRMLLTL